MSNLAEATFNNEETVVADTVCGIPVALCRIRQTDGELYFVRRAGVVVGQCELRTMDDAMNKLEMVCQQTRKRYE